MKLQYLGDSKDAFKWDLVHQLATSLGIQTAMLSLMMTDDDSSGQGSTQPSRFPADSEIIQYCMWLHANRSLKSLLEMPSRLGGLYKLSIADLEVKFTESVPDYFKFIKSTNSRLILLDPDNGFEPKKKTNKHLAYADLVQLHAGSPDLVTITFHHHRRKKFSDDFRAIRDSIAKLDNALFPFGLYWNDLMFVITCGDLLEKSLGEFCMLYASKKAGAVKVFHPNYSENTYFGEKGAEQIMKINGKVASF